MYKAIIAGLMISFLGLGTKLYSGEGNQQPFSVWDNVKQSNLMQELREIWPNGKCANHISGNSRFVLVTWACKDSYSASNRQAFLKLMESKGWKLKKETYRLDRNNAGYFYKFEVNYKRNIYFRLFFRQPAVVWPIHENKRPQFILVINNIITSADLDTWSKVKIPITFSLSMQAINLKSLTETAQKSKRDIWISFSGFNNPLQEKKPGLQSEAKSETKNEIKNDINKEQAGQNSLLQLETLIKDSPEQNFPFSGLTIAADASGIKEVEALRELFTVLKKGGIRKVISPYTLEVKDTAKIFEIEAFTNSYYLQSSDEKNERIWKEAFENARSSGYSIIIIDAHNPDSRRFIFKKLEQNGSFEDFTNLSNYLKP